MVITDPGIERAGRSQRMQQTRELIIQAALDLAAEDQHRRLTAERIAERAGVSRRTFFNYFPTVEASFYAPVQHLVQVAVEHLEQIPTDVPLHECLTRALTEAAAEEPLDRIGLCAHVAARMPQLQGSDLEQWESAEALLAEVFEKRYPHLETFVVRCLTGAVVGACRAAIHEWDRHTAGRFTDASETLLHDLIATSVTHVSTGFGSVVNGP